MKGFDPIKTLAFLLVYFVVAFGMVSSSTECVQMRCTQDKIVTGNCCGSTLYYNTQGTAFSYEKKRLWVFDDRIVGCGANCSTTYIRRVCFQITCFDEDDPGVEPY